MGKGANHTLIQQRRLFPESLIVQNAEKNLIKNLVENPVLSKAQLQQILGEGSALPERNFDHEFGALLRVREAFESAAVVFGNDLIAD